MAQVLVHPSSHPHSRPYIEELEKMDASEIHAKRLNAKEVITLQNGEQFIFPLADGKVKLSGGDQDLRTSTLIRDHPLRGENHRITQKIYAPSKIQGTISL